MTIKTKRIKPTGLTNRIDFECTVDRCSYIETELRSIAAARAARVVIAQSYGVEEEAELKAEQKAKVTLCEKFALCHRVELLPDGKKAKSAETPLSRYGFRTGTPALKLVSKMTWEQVVVALQVSKRKLWLRTKIEAAKDVMLAAVAARPKNSDVLLSLGVRVVQEETFFIEPKVDGAETLKAEAV